MMYKIQTLILKQTFVPYTQQLSKNAFRKFQQIPQFKLIDFKDKFWGGSRQRKSMEPFVRQELARQHFWKHSAQLTNLYTTAKWTQTNFWY